jgi:hypothetical protein
MSSLSRKPQASTFLKWSMTLSLYLDLSLALCVFRILAEEPTPVAASFEYDVVSRLLSR